jgi:hypothetical protein
MAGIKPDKRPAERPDQSFERGLEQLVRLLARQAAIQHCGRQGSESSSLPRPASFPGELDE